MKILLSMSQSTPTHLYKWVNSVEWQKYLRENKLPAKRWKRFVEPLGKIVTGNSFTDKSHINRWKLPEYDLLVTLKTSGLPNRIWPQNGNRSHLQTLGMLKPNFDPKAYMHESEEVDEFFVEGPILNLRSNLV
jgi:hypothetical protein